MLRLSAIAVALLYIGGSADIADAQVQVTRNVIMPARDGVRLATDIYLPAVSVEAPAGKRFPAILLRTPYNKTGFAGEMAEHFAKHGYAVATQDVRGRFASEGEFYIYLNEGHDGYDAVEWVAKQPWCDGRVGTYGQSYLSQAEHALAVLRPPHLKTMFSLVGTANYIEDGAGRGGAFALLHNLAYAYRMAGSGKEAAANKATEAALKEAGEKLGQWLLVSPLKPDSPLRFAPSYQRWYDDWLRHPAYDDYWKQNGYNFEDRYGEYPDIPICLVGGWYDIFLRGTLTNFTGLSRQAKRMAPTRLLMGPWTHSTGLSHAEGVDFGPAAAVDLKHEALAWFDRYLKPAAGSTPAASGSRRDGPTGALADKDRPVRYFLMRGGEATKNKEGRLQASGAWQTGATWPPPGYREMKLYLHGDGSLRPQPPEHEKSVSSFEFDPEKPVPTIGGNIDAGKELVRRGAQNQVLQTGDYGATNQLPLSARRDVLTFETPPLESELEAVGPLHVDVWVSSSAKDTDITAKVIDVYPPSADYPNGFAVNLEDGILRLRFRESREREKLLTTGEVYRVRIDLWATANIFARGHRVRLDISSSNFPMYDVNPNTGEPLHRHTHTVKAINSVYHSRARPSCLVLPLRATAEKMNSTP